MKIAIFLHLARALPAGAKLFERDRPYSERPERVTQFIVTRGDEYAFITGLSECLGSSSSTPARGTMRIAATWLAVMLSTSAVFAADLPNKTEAPTPTPVAACWSSLDIFLNSNASECPISAFGFTLYGAVDAGLGWQSHGEPFNRYYANGVSELITRYSNGPRFSLTPNGLGQSNLGIKMKEPLGGDFSLVGDAQFGFDPYSLQLVNGPKSLYQNSALPYANQSANSDAFRAGQWDNTFGYVGVASRSLGAITLGRQSALTFDAMGVYDPMVTSYAFSLLNTLGGAGAGETAAYNTSIKYLYSDNGLRFGAIAQLGSYGLGNGAAAGFQLQAGANVGAFSFDGYFSHNQGAVVLSTLSGSNLSAVTAPSQTNGDLKATISDNTAVALMAKYARGAANFYAGYLFINYANPASPVGAPFTDIGGYVTVDGFLNQNAYPNDKHLQVLWTGVRYALTDQIDLAGAYYFRFQNDYSGGSAKTLTGSNGAATTYTCAQLSTSQGACAGHENVVSAMIEYRPVKRVELYAGAMFSQVSGGIASGFTTQTGGNGFTSNFEPTIGLRVQF